jgi:hypothetical protein
LNKTTQARFYNFFWNWCLWGKQHWSNLSGFENEKLKMWNGRLHSSHRQSGTAYHPSEKERWASHVFL